MKKRPRYFVHVCSVVFFLSSAASSAQTGRDNGHPAAQNIFDAVGDGDLEKVKSLLMENPGFIGERHDQSGYTPLHQAAATGRTEICELLIAKGADIHATDGSQNTPLHVAAFDGSVDVAALLVRHGADIHLRGREGGTSLHMAAWGGHREMVKWLIDRGADVNAKDTNDYTPFIWATAGTTTDALDELVKHGADLRPKIRIGRSILHLAAGNGNAEVVEYLLHAGLEIDERSDYGNTPLFWAVRNKNYDAANVLITNGADPKITNNDGHSPLTLAVSGNATDMVDLLTKHGIDVAEQDGSGDTHLHAAAYHGFEEMIRFLLDRGADPNVANDRGITALDLAIVRGHVEAQDLLVSAGAERGQSGDENTGLMTNFVRPGPGTDALVTIRIIYDNYTFEGDMEAGYGFSCYIEGADKNILFDTGTRGDLFRRNFKASGIDPADVDVVVISHEHGDHTGGLFAFLEMNPEVSVVVPFSVSYVLVRKIESCGATVRTVKDPVEICRDVYVGGELGGRIKEQSLAVNTDQGLVVVVGCSHPGVFKIAENFKDVMGRNIHLVLGGFHLMNQTEQETKAVIDQLKKLGVQKCGPAHCTGEKQIQVFEDAFGGDFVKTGVGRKIILPF